MIQGDRKSGLTAGLFAHPGSSMCVGPKVSQSGTHTSAGDTGKIFRGQREFNSLMYYWNREEVQTAASFIDVDEWSRLFSVSLVRYQCGQDVKWDVTSPDCHIHG